MTDTSEQNLPKLLKSCVVPPDGYRFGEHDPRLFVRAGLLREKRPSDAVARNWSERRAPIQSDLPISAWISGPIVVMSSLIVAELPDGSGEEGLQWLVSATTQGKRPKEEHVRRALRAFGMTKAEEDNHHPGNARQFFLVLETHRRRDCECKATEVVIKEKDGYTWSNTKDEKDCRGCELQRLIPWMPCPIH